MAAKNAKSTTGQQTHMEQILRSALDHHAAGQLAEAEEL